VPCLFVIFCHFCANVAWPSRRILFPLFSIFVLMTVYDLFVIRWYISFHLHLHIRSRSLNMWRPFVCFTRENATAYPLLTDATRTCARIFPDGVCLFAGSCVYLFRHPTAFNVRGDCLDNPSPLFRSVSHSLLVPYAGSCRLFSCAGFLHHMLDRSIQPQAPILPSCMAVMTLFARAFKVVA